MVRTSRFALRFLGATSLAAATIGCSLAPKSYNDPAPKVVASKSSVSVSTSPPEFSVSDKLNDPVKMHLAYALWHEQEGNLVEARNSYKKVLELKTGHWWERNNANNVDAILGLARLDIASNRMDDANQRLLKAQKLAPSNPQVAVTLGQYHIARGDLPKALEQMKTAHLLAPDDMACVYHLGVVQAKLGDMDSALTSFTEAVGAAEAQYNVAYILYGQGNMDGAEEHLKKAITLKPSLAQAQSLLLTVRQHRTDARTQLAQRPLMRSSTDFGTQVQPASYTEFSPPPRGPNATSNGN